MYSISSLTDEIKVDLGTDVVSLGISNQTIQLKILEALRKISSYAPRVIYAGYQNAAGAIQMPNDTQCVVAVYSVSDPTSNASYVDNEVFSWTTMMYNSGSSVYDPFTILTMRNQVQNLQNFISIRDWTFNKSNKKLYLSNISGSIAVKFLKPYSNINEIEDEIVYQYTKEYALALCKIIEGMIRRKLQNTPGAMQLDGDSLVSEGTSEKDRLDSLLPSVFKYLRFGIRI